MYLRPWLEMEEFLLKMAMLGFDQNDAILALKGEVESTTNNGAFDRVTRGAAQCYEPWPQPMRTAQWMLYSRR